MTYTYSTICYVCHNSLNTALLPNNNTETQLGSRNGNDYVLLKMTPTDWVDRGHGNKVSYHSTINYRHRFHGEAGERPYQT